MECKKINDSELSSLIHVFLSLKWVHKRLVAKVIIRQTIVSHHAVYRSRIVFHFVSLFLYIAHKPWELMRPWVGGFTAKIDEISVEILKIFHCCTFFY